MTKDDIIRMAKEAGLGATHTYKNKSTYSIKTIDNLEAFANLVAAAERERCIGIIHGQCGSDNVAQRTVDAIRSQS